MKNRVVSFLLTAAFIASPFTASAATVDELLVQVQALLKQVELLRTQVDQERGNSSSAPSSSSVSSSTGVSASGEFCYTWTRNLRVGDRGNDVDALVKALALQGFIQGAPGERISGEDFDERIGSALTAFQEKYFNDILRPNGLQRGNGYAGPSTRAKLNALYACKNARNTLPGEIKKIPDVTTSIPVSGVILSASLLSSSDDKAGGWDVFSPGIGNINKNSADWNWRMVLTFKENKTVKRITLVHNSRGEVWSTGYSRYLSNGTDLYGYDEHPYPLVVIAEKNNQLNTAYDQALSMGGASAINSTNTYLLYGQKESSTFTGGKLVVEFTDGTSATSVIAAQAISLPATATQPSITVVSPNPGETFKTDQIINIIWKAGKPLTQPVLYVVSEGDGGVNRYSRVLVANSEGTMETFDWRAVKADGKYAIRICDDGANPTSPLSPCSDARYVFKGTTGANASQCSDSDGGINLNVSGLTDGRVNGIGSYFRDTAVTSNGGVCSGDSCTSVAEGYCENGKVTNYLYHCPSGKSQNGACLPLLQSSIDKESLIKTYYLEYLRREAEPAGITYWKQFAPEQIKSGILGSHEYVTKQSIIAIFKEVLQRSPSNTELHSWYEKIYDSKWTLEQVRQGIAGSTQASGASITVRSPNGGEGFVVGKEFLIKWLNANLPSSTNIDSFTFKLVSSSGSEYDVPVIKNSLYQGGIVGYVNPNGASNYSTVVPNVPSGEYRLKINCSTCSLSDSSDTRFKIISASQAPTLTVTSPKGGASLSPGSTVTVTWTSANLKGDAVIDVGFYGEANTTLGFHGALNDASSINDGTHTFTIPSSATPSTYRVQISCRNCMQDYGYNPNAWGDAVTVGHSPSAPSYTLTVLSPNGGESITEGQTKRITWSASGLDTVSLYVRTTDSRYNTEVYKPIAYNVPASQGYYDFVYNKTTLPYGSYIPLPYRIHIKGFVNGSTVANMTDESNADFTVTPVQAATVTLPNAVLSGACSTVSTEYGNFALKTTAGTVRIAGKEESVIGSDGLYGGSGTMLLYAKKSSSGVVAVIGIAESQESTISSDNGVRLGSAVFDSSGIKSIDNANSSCADYTRPAATSAKEIESSLANVYSAVEQILKSLKELSR